MPQSPRAKRSKKSPRAKRTKKSPRLQSCKERLASKIKINMIEYKDGRWKSPKQAIAVSYSQVLKKFPRCKSALRRRSK